MPEMKEIEREYYGGRYNDDTLNTYSRRVYSYGDRTIIIDRLLDGEEKPFNVFTDEELVDLHPWFADGKSWAWVEGYVEAWLDNEMQND